MVRNRIRFEPCRAVMGAHFPDQAVLFKRLKILINRRQRDRRYMFLYQVVHGFRTRMAVHSGECFEDDLSLMRHRQAMTLAYLPETFRFVPCCIPTTSIV